jgi:rod shape determining protein RodA
LLVTIAGLSVLFIAGISWRLITVLVLSAGAAAPLLWHFMHDYQKRRVLMFFDPEQDPLGSGYHIIQSQIAIGSGGIYGKGWLNGTQSHLEFLPERSTDFIFAVYSEEFGLMGAILLVSIYLFVIGRGLDNSHVCPADLWKITCCGINSDFFCLCICEYRNGHRSIASGRHTLAIDQSGWHIACYTDAGIWYPDVH